jgi:hypothetical protein
MDPSDSQCSPVRFRFLIRAGYCSSCITAPGLQHCTVYLPQHAIPATPEDPNDRFRSPGLRVSAFPNRPLGRHLHLLITRLHLGSLALRPAALPAGNLRPSVTRTPLPLATRVHGQLPGRDSNPQDRQLLLRTDALLKFYNLGFQKVISFLCDGLSPLRCESNAGNTHLQDLSKGRMRDTQFSCSPKAKEASRLHLSRLSPF